MSATKKATKSEHQKGTPWIAHMEDWFAPEPLTGLCGKKLLGITAPKDAEKCVVCLDLSDAYFERKREYLNIGGSES